MKSEINWELVAKYLSGECSAEELIEVEKWLAESEDNRKLLESMKKVWNTSGENFEDSDVKSLWENVSERSGISRDASSATVLNLKPEEKVISNFSAIYNSTAFRYAAVFMFIVSAALIYFVTADKPGLDEWVSVNVKNGELQSIVLDDGSKIVADAGSRVEYPKNFGEGSRDIKLIGEAYFEVYHNPDIPFRVYSGNALIEVLGTKFNVRSWEESENITVSVAEGKVSFGTADSNNPVFLEKGFTVELNKNGIMAPVREVNTKRILSWLDGEIYFENTRVSEVLAQLERWYDVQINIADKSIVSERLSIFIHNYSLLDNIDLVSRMTSSRYYVDKKIITLTPSN